MDQMLCGSNFQVFGGFFMKKEVSIIQTKRDSNPKKLYKVGAEQSSSRDIGFSGFMISLLPQ